MTLIPLRNRAGEIVAYAQVDPEDALRLQAFRWNLMRRGYVKRHVSTGDGRRVTSYLHREVLGLSSGGGPVVDHVNGDKLDNRKSNLRLCSPAENLQNQHARKGAVSRFRGVWWEAPRRKWRAGARLEGRQRALGYFTDEIDAALAAEAFRREHMPFAQPDPELAKALAVAKEAT